MTIAPKPGVLDVHVYVPGRSEASGVARTYKLSSNESPFGPIHCRLTLREVFDKDSAGVAGR